MSLFDRQILEQSWSVIYHWKAFNFAILNLVKSEKWICPTLSGFRQNRSHIQLGPRDVLSLPGLRLWPVHLEFILKLIRVTADILLDILLVPDCDLCCLLTHAFSKLLTL